MKTNVSYIRRKIYGKIPTKDRILDSALTLFSKKGYDGVGVDLIAENAGIFAHHKIQY